MVASRTGRLGAALAELARTLLAVAIVFAVCDVALRAVYAARGAMLDRVTLPYVLGHKYGPLPPWVDGVRILDDDPVLLWRGRAGIEQTYVDVFTAVEREEARTRLLRQFVPRVPESIENNATWTISLNSEGFRGPELPSEKPADTFRIVFLGDSWTFGVGVDEEATTARRTERFLREAHPERTIEVLNLGVMGYTSLQGLRLLRSRALELAPDLIVIGFAMNDSSVPGYRDKDVAPPPGGKPLASRLADLAEHIEVYKLLRYAVALWRHQPEPLGERLRSAQERIGSEQNSADYAEMEPWTRVSPVDYESNLREMISVARDAGAEVVLLYNEFQAESPYRGVLRRIRADTGVPLVDASLLLGTERDRIEAARARALGCAPAGLEAGGAASETIEVVFRALAAQGPLYVVAAHPALGAGEPNRVAMRDDGVAPDEHAGDGVWTLGVALEPGARLVYMYTRGGAPGRWEGLDVPAFRRLVLPQGTRGGRVLRPIEVFGAIDLKTDAWHTNAAGNALIGAELGRVIADLPPPRGRR